MPIEGRLPYERIERIDILRGHKPYVTVDGKLRQRFEQGARLADLGLSRYDDYPWPGTADRRLDAGL
jgi:hypothetical protein